jgi:SHS family lactate transporter-like MFS transporter
MFWVAIIPALLTFWMRRNVPESPVWLERRRLIREGASKGRTPVESKTPVWRIFRPDLIGVTLHTTAVIGAFMCVYYSVNYWYPTYLRESGRQPLNYLIAFNIGAIVGTAVWGRLSEGVLGRRGAVTITIVVGMASLPLYLHAHGSWPLAIGAFLMGGFGMGIWGMAPAYTNERFPTFVRGVGPGFCYHAGAAIGAIMPTLLGAMQKHGWQLTTAMSAAMLVSGCVSAVLIWIGPETRGRAFTADEGEVPR